jgi:hypothetical protein
VLAEVAQECAVEGVVGKERARCPREDDLSPVGGRADPGGAVEVQPDVVLARTRRGTGMQAHPNANAGPLGPRVAREGALRRRRRSGGVVRACERDEEGIALGAELAATVRLERCPEEAVMGGESLAVPLAERVEEAGRPLDVGEQQRDLAGGKLGPWRWFSHSLDVPRPLHAECHLDGKSEHFTAWLAIATASGRSFRSSGLTRMPRCDGGSALWSTRAGIRTVAA